MTLRRFLSALIRRWYILVPGLIVTVGLTFGVYHAVSPSYTRTASELLVPGSSSIPKNGNPFLYLGGLSQAADVTVNALQATQVQGRLVAANPGTTVTVVRDTTTSGPIIDITVEGNSREAVDRVFDGMTAAVPTTVTDLENQIGVPASARISTLPLAVMPKAKAVQKTRIEATGIAAVGTLAATLLAVGLVDGLLLARRNAVDETGDDDAAPERNTIDPQDGDLEEPGDVDAASDELDADTVRDLDPVAEHEDALTGSAYDDDTMTSSALLDADVLSGR